MSAPPLALNRGEASSRWPRHVPTLRQLSDSLSGSVLRRRTETPGLTQASQQTLFSWESQAETHSDFVNGASPRSVTPRRRWG